MTGNLSSEPARRGEGWTDDDHERLIEAIRGGLDLGEVADRLQRSRGSIRSRARRLVPGGASSAGRHAFEALRTAVLADPAYDWKTHLQAASRERGTGLGATSGATIAVMGVVKKSVSLEASVAERVETAAHEDGLSFSTWLSAAAERQLILREGLRAVSDWEREAGRLSDEELAAGEVLLDRLLSAATRTSGSTRAEAS